MLLLLLELRKYFNRLISKYLLSISVCHISVINVFIYAEGHSFVVHYVSKADVLILRQLER